MLHRSIISLIENTGYVNRSGKRIYGTAALLHFIHTPASALNRKHIETGKQYVQTKFNA